MHLQEDFTPIVVQYIRQHGFAYWEDLYHHIEATLPLSTEDYATLADGSIRYESNIRNLKSNRSLVMHHADIIQIRGGFATGKFAQDNNIPEQTSTNVGRRTPRAPRGPRPMKITGKGEKAIRLCWNQHFKELKELYDNAFLLADIRNPEMTAVAFGEKYNLTPVIV